jgi:hypothetical protein
MDEDERGATTYIGRFTGESWVQENRVLGKGKYNSNGYQNGGFQGGSGKLLIMEPGVQNYGAKYHNLDFCHVQNICSLRLEVVPDT